MTRDAEHTPAPQSVVVRRADLEEVRDLLMERIHGSNARSPDHNARLAVEAMLAAAPAPSSLAGGEWLETEGARVGIVNIIERHISGWAGEHADSPYDAAVEIGRDIFHLAALSPEAPAREGVDAHQTVGPIDYDKLRSIIHSATNAVLPFANAPMKTPFSTQERAGMQVEIADLIVADLEKAGGRTPALTPRHEAPAALCDHGHTDPMALCSDCEAASVEAPAEGAGEMDDDDASTYAPSVAGLSDYLWNQAQAADSVEGRCILEMWREAVDALRARSSAPEAREGEA